MTLLSICKAVTSVCGFAVPVSVQTTEETNVQLIALANEALEDLSEEYNWPQLEIEYPINLVGAQDVYEWPSDFRKTEAASLFRSDEYFRVKGSVNIIEWNKRKYGLLGSLSCLAYRTYYSPTTGAAGIQVTPTPDSAGTMVGLYYTNNYASDGAMVPTFKAKYELDTDVSRIPERLVKLGLMWRFRRAKGLDFSAELAQYNSVIAKQFSDRIGPADIVIGRKNYFTNDGLTDGYVPDNGFG